jgi:uncharacterized protein GlcG (DUF336 family)
MTQPNRHSVSVAAVVTDDDGRVLVVQRRDGYSTRWTHEKPQSAFTMVFVCSQRARYGRHSGRLDRRLPRDAAASPVCTARRYPTSPPIDPSTI